MKALLVASVLALALVALSAPLASAGSSTLTATAKESGCPKTFCFELSTSTITAGDTVTATLNNPNGNTQHSFCVLIGGAWKCAPASGYASGGTSATVTFIAPASGTVQYECSFPGHAQLGMAGNLTVQQAPSTTNATGNPGTGGSPSAGAGGKSSPSVGVVAMVLGAGLLAVALRRR